MKLEKIIPRSQSFSDWYTSVVSSAKLALYAPIKGTIIFQPNGWSIWSSIIKVLDEEFKKIGIENVQLPTFIRYADFVQEKKHIAGFAPELFLVTKKGDELLEDPYVIRPTSEVAFCNYFKAITNSYNDLPFLYNQWCNCFRVEKTTRPFLRNSEFYWQEMHSIHSTVTEALDTVTSMIKIYEKFVTEILCIPVLMGEKTEGERFAGAIKTYTIEALMQDGQALQCGTAHYLGQNFSKTYDIKFQTKSNSSEFVYQTSAGVSTRLIGGIIMSHADDKGLVLPPDIAPIQVALLPLFVDKNIQTLNLANTIKVNLENKYRIKIDSSDKGMGYKLAEQEVIGTPIMIVIGPKDLQENCLTIVRRDTEEKIQIKIDDLEKTIVVLMKEIKTNIFQIALKRLQNSIVEVNNLEEFKKAIEQRKLVLAPWCGIAEQEAKVRELTGATPRCIKSEIIDGNEKCFLTGKPATQLVYFGRSY